MPAAAAPGDSAHLTPDQVAELLGGKIIGSYASASPPGPVVYGPRDAAAVLMAHGYRVALRDSAYFVDGERVASEVLDQLAAELEPGADRGDARAIGAPEAAS